MMNPAQDFQKPSRRVLLLACMMLPILFAAPSSIPPVHAAGSLFVGPAQQGPFTVGTIIAYQVNVTGMDPFDGWDVVVQADLSVLDPLSISVAGNMLGSVTQVANCVNGTGSGCSINDNAGGAHSAAASFSTPIGGSGLLFTITYRVVNDGFSYLTIPAGLDVIVNSGTSVAHSDSQPAVYGHPPIVPLADFTFSPATPTQGDDVIFNASLSSDPNPGARIVSYAWTITQLSGGVLYVTNTTSQPVWVHVFRGLLEVGDLSVQLIVTDNLGLSSRPLIRIITVLAHPDFSISVKANLLTIRPGHSATLDLIFKSTNGFAGNVTLSVSGLPSGVLLSFSQNSVALTGNPLATTIVTVTIAVHAGPGDRFFQVTAMHGDLVHYSPVISVITPRPQTTAPL